MKESVAGRSMTALELLAKAAELRRSASSFKSLVAVQRALKIAEELETEAGYLTPVLGVLTTSAKAPSSFQPTIEILCRIRAEQDRNLLVILLANCDARSASLAENDLVAIFVDWAARHIFRQGFDPRTPHPGLPTWVQRNLPRPSPASAAGRAAPAAGPSYALHG